MDNNQNKQIDSFQHVSIQFVVLCYLLVFPFIYPPVGILIVVPEEPGAVTLS